MFGCPGGMGIVVIMLGAGPGAKPGYVRIAGGGAIGLDSAFDGWSGVALLVMETLRQSASKQVAPFSIAGAVAAFLLSSANTKSKSPSVLHRVDVRPRAS